VRWFYLPVLTDIGDLLCAQFLAGGTKKESSGGKEEATWILAPGSYYVLRFTNRAGAAQPYGIKFDYHEHSD